MNRDRWPYYWADLAEQHRIHSMSDLNILVRETLNPEEKS